MYRLTVIVVCAALGTFGALLLHETHTGTSDSPHTPPPAHASHPEKRATTSPPGVPPKTVAEAAGSFAGASATVDGALAADGLLAGTFAGASVTGGMLGTVGAGGALGAMTRYGISPWVGSVDWFGYHLPLGVLTANILGSFGSGVMLGWASVNHAINPTWPALITFGFMGGLTAYSGFSQETVILSEQAGMTAAAFSVGFSIWALLLGRQMGAWLTPMFVP